MERPAGGGLGTNYRLVGPAARAPGGSRGRYECVVWGVPGSRTSTWKLLGFKAL
uniref:Cysteine proteinase inhibitor n=1 Tax=Aegilops tauschii TaxID=37682 RepID=N1QUS1_AEGTA